MHVHALEQQMCDISNFWGLDSSILQKHVGRQGNLHFS